MRPPRRSRTFTYSAPSMRHTTTRPAASRVLRSGCTYRRSRSAMPAPIIESPAASYASRAPRLANARGISAPEALAGTAFGSCRSRRCAERSASSARDLLQLLLLVGRKRESALVEQPAHVLVHRVSMLH